MTCHWMYYPVVIRIIFYLFMYYFIVFFCLTRRNIINEFKLPIWAHIIRPEKIIFWDLTYLNICLIIGIATFDRLVLLHNKLRFLYIVDILIIWNVVCILFGNYLGCLPRHLLSEAYLDIEIFHVCLYFKMLYRFCNPYVSKLELSPPPPSSTAASAPVPSQILHITSTLKYLVVT